MIFEKIASNYYLKIEDNNIERIIFEAINIASKKEANTMSRNRGMMSERLKEEIAKELGVYNTVATEGWGSVSSRDCGNIVKKAIEMAERNLLNQ